MTEKAELIYRKYIKCGLDENGILHISFIGVDKTFDEKKQKTKPCLSLILMMELHEFFAEMNKYIEQDKENIIKEIYLEGFTDANVFAIGADIKEFAKIIESSKDKNTLYKKAMIFSEIGQTALLEIIVCSKKVTAIINEFALGGGLELAMACHARIAKSNAILGLPETTLGLIPGWGGTQWWKYIPKIDRGKFIEYIKTGATFNAQEALKIGLIDSIIDTETEIPAAVNPPKPYSKSSAAMIEEIVNTTSNINTSVDSWLSLEKESFAAAMTSPDGKEGIMAFLEKREPNFN